MGYFKTGEAHRRRRKASKYLFSSAEMVPQDFQAVDVVSRGLLVRIPHQGRLEVVIRLKWNSAGIVEVVTAEKGGCSQLLPLLLQSKCLLCTAFHLQLVAFRLCSHELHS
ncbi:hypothetical protein M758_6G183000 [Ceratodon purpureus]|uniref:Uncharacterized protein n=1 Tax=Ceratodon purpureus TaxID=3225 RepID=A0A8T0HJ65_CERPU|nr:hypothetical protein KC19_6G190400 [Ceratodon purpureus]KAG0614513.1 hypothetical protein M758_6G183000 [Ceratodon purpureus]